jgi:hypothetical protein
MADFDKNPDRERSDTGRTGDPSGDKSEWLRDQTGEDHNLSGSDTFRTLPDQPENDEEAGRKDASDRQSKR